MKSVKKAAVAAAVSTVAGLAALTLTGCSNHVGDHIDYGEVEVDRSRPDAAMPYGQEFKDLANRDPAEVATAALEQLCTFSSEEYDQKRVAHRIQGVVTPGAWRVMSENPRTIRPEIILRMWATWDEAGGTQDARVEVSDEIHPDDTETTWERKLACYRTMDGFDETFVDVYATSLEKVEGQWRIARLQLLSSTYTIPTATESQ